MLSAFCCCCAVAGAKDESLAVATISDARGDGVHPAVAAEFARQVALHSVASESRRSSNTPVVVDTFMGAGILVEARADGFNVVELIQWRLSNGCCATVYVREVWADPVGSVLLDSANLLEDTRRISGISVAIKEEEELEYSEALPPL